MTQTLAQLPVGRLLDYTNDGSEIYSGNYSTSLSSTATLEERQGAFNLAANGTYPTTGYMDARNNHWHKIIFPTARTITGFFIFSRWSLGTPATFTIKTSPDATSYNNGTWNTVRTFTAPQSSNLTPPTVQMRDEATYLVKLDPPQLLTGIYIDGDSSDATDMSATLRSLMIWTSDVPEGLHMWHPTLDQALDAQTMDNLFSNPDSYNGQALTEATFRVKNTHSSLTANDVTVGPDSTGTLWGDLTTELLVNYNAGGFLASYNIGNLAPGAISNVITVRRPSPSGQTPGTGRMALVQATPVNWS